MDKLKYGWPEPSPVGLPDGGLVTVRDPELVPLADGGGAQVRKSLGYTRDGVAAVFAVIDGSPVCVELTVSAPGGLTTADLRALRLERLVTDAYAYVGTYTRHGDGWLRVIGPAAARSDRERVTQAVRRRRATPELLDRVRELHNNATGTPGQRVEAVAAELEVSPRTVRRYLAKAGL